MSITKGKTTKYTGTREVVCRDEIFGCIDELRERFSNRKPKDKLFRLADGQTTKERQVNQLKEWEAEYRKRGCI